MLLVFIALSMCDACRCYLCCLCCCCFCADCPPGSYTTESFGLIPCPTPNSRGDYICIDELHLCDHITSRDDRASRLVWPHLAAYETACCRLRVWPHRTVSKRRGWERGCLHVLLAGQWSVDDYRMNSQFLIIVDKWIYQAIYRHNYGSI